MISSRNSAARFRHGGVDSGGPGHHRRDQAHRERGLQAGPVHVRGLRSRRLVRNPGARG